jgi:phage terminase Nu1 subunit (DNA packaging protein)
MATKTELTSDEIKHVAGWNEVTFKLQLTKGLKECRTGNDLYDARKFFLWYRDNVYRPGLSGGDDGNDLDVISHRARYEKARAQKYQIKLKKLREKYVPLEDAEYALMEMCGVFAEIVEALPELLAEAIHGQNEDTMLIETDKIVRGMLLEYSKLGDEHEGS